MFETEKRLEDYRKEHFMIPEKVFEKMTYQERVQLFNEHPEEYARLTRRDSTPERRSSGQFCSTQVRKE